MELLYIKETSSPVAEVGGRLERVAQNHQFGVINVIDLREKMHSKGVEFGPACIIYEVCNPHRAKEVLERKLEISTALPCRISVYKESGKTKVSTMLPTQVLGLFGAEDLDSVAESVQSDLISMIDEVVRE